MKELSEYLSDNRIDSVAHAVEALEQKLSAIEREAASYLIVDFPRRDRLQEIADALLEKMHSEVVQVNSINSTQQITVTTSPHELVTKVPLEYSFCVVTVGSGEPLMISDIGTDPLFDGSPVRNIWGSWASAPIVIRGLDAGSVCVLQHGARAWNDDDKKILQETAQSISSEINNWLSSKD